MGVLSAQSNNSGVATVSLSGNMLTVDGVDTGSTTITVSASEGTNYTAVSASLSVAVQFVITIPVVPSQKGTLTYNGEAQMAEWNDLNTEELTLVGASYQTNAGTYTMGFQPKPGYQWWDGTTETKNATWTIRKAMNNVSLLPSGKVTLNANNKSVTYTASTRFGGDISVSWSNPDYSQYASFSFNNENKTVTVLAKKELPNNLNYISLIFLSEESENWDSLTNSRMIDIESLTSVFGVSWDSSQPSTALTRLTKANDPNKLVTVDITTEPVPAVGTGSGSSPFDNYMPWMGMEEYTLNNETGRVSAKKGDPGFTRTNINLPVMVKIPEFYYKIERVGSIFRYYVADGPVDGLSLHPGSGDNYLARYEAGEASSGTMGPILASYSGTTPSVGKTRSEFRDRARNMATGFQLRDIAAWCAYDLLYLVEYADWDSQEKINRGIVNDTAAAHKTGETDAMVYHTGRANSGDNSAVQYRGIENPWGNVSEFIDGINIQSKTAYICTEPESYADDTTDNYTSSGITLPNSGFIKGLGLSSGFPWAFIPNDNGGSETTYIPDYVYSNSGWRVLRVGGGRTYGEKAGLFFSSADYSSSDSSAICGTRLQFREVKA